MELRVKNTALQRSLQRSSREAHSTDVDEITSQLVGVDLGTATTPIQAGVPSASPIVPRQTAFIFQDAVIMAIARESIDFYPRGHQLDEGIAIVQVNRRLKDQISFENQAESDAADPAPVAIPTYEGVDSPPDPQDPETNFEPRRNRRKYKCYIIFRGREIGIFTSWYVSMYPLSIAIITYPFKRAECNANIQGVSKPLYCGCRSIEDAQAAFQYARDCGWVPNEEGISTPRSSQEFGEDNIELLTHPDWMPSPVSALVS